MSLEPLKKFLSILFLVGLFSYFLYHIIQGERGILAWDRLSGLLEKTEKELRFLEKERDTLERHVTLLGDPLDLDLLDSQVRSFLDYSHPREKILINSNP